MTSCKYCSEEIIFDDGHISKNGKKIPLDFGTGEPHNCKARAIDLSCYNCGQSIYFDKDRKSESGKMIPQDREKGGDHDCKQLQPHHE